MMKNENETDDELADAVALPSLNNGIPYDIDGAPRRAAVRAAMLERRREQMEIMREQEIARDDD
jgi:hypothetical protein